MLIDLTRLSGAATVLALAMTLTALPQAATALEAPFVGESLNERPCSSFERTTQGFGPFDYRRFSSEDRKLKLVEEAHFTPEVASLQGGRHGKTPQGDINYTLRAFPNHHQALFSLIRYYTGEAKQLYGIDPFNQVEYPPPECFLQRAIAFRPQDANLYFLFGIYLHRLGHLKPAEGKYRKGLEIAPDSAEGNYNFGLLLYEMGRYAEAQERARKAYNLGYPLPGLKHKLVEKGFAP
jgi:tetratricopeptide (TPR) repeat protein